MCTEYLSKKKLDLNQLLKRLKTHRTAGDKIVFTSMRSGDLELYTMDLDGSNVQQVTDELGYDGGAFFTPDCSTIVWRASRPEGDALDVESALSRCLKRVDDSFQHLNFNTAIAAIMELTNHLARLDGTDAQSRAVLQEAWSAVVRLLAPIAPHIGEELCRTLGGDGPVYRAAWPEVDEAARESARRGAPMSEAVGSP